jgi:hypothetical protein
LIKGGEALTRLLLFSHREGRRVLNRDITYEDFNGETVTETFYFNLTKTEIIELEVQYKTGLEETIKAIIKAEDNKSLIAEFKKIVLLAYGVKSDDGRRFIKNETLREEFAQSAAYDALFMEMASNEAVAAEFIMGVIPKDLTIDQDKPDGPPRPRGLVDVPLPPVPPGVT